MKVNINIRLFDDNNKELKIGDRIKILAVAYNNIKSDDKYHYGKIEHIDYKFLIFDEELNGVNYSNIVQYEYITRIEKC